MPSIINATTTNGLVTSADNSGSLQLQTNNGTTAVTIDTSQNVGIGTSSPAARLHVSSPDGTAPLTLNTAGGSDSTRALNFNVAGDNYGKILVPSGSGGAMAFWTGGANAAAERMRLTSGGDLLVGTTASVYYGAEKLSLNATSTTAGIGINTSTGSGIGINIQSGTSGSKFHAFAIAGTERGSISYNGSGTNYNTSSDYRLKENIAPMTGALNKISALKPCTYIWKETGEKSEGFIAHELQAVVPECVTGEKDAVDEEGNPVYQGIDTSFLVATLTAAIQELKAELDSVKSELAVMKGTE